MKRSGAVTMPQCLATAPVRIRNRISAPGASSVTGDLEHHRPRRLGQRLARAGLAPVAAVGRDRHRLGAVELAPDPADQPEAVAADAPEARLVVVGRAEPAARGGDDAARDRRQSQHLSRCWRRRGSGSGSPCPGRGCAGSRGSSTTLANRSRQVSSRLSQPARTTKSSPAAIGRTGASSSVEPPRRRRRRRGSRPRRRRPAFGAAGPGQPAEGEPAGREAAEPGGGEAAVAGQRGDRAGRPCRPDRRGRRRSGRRRARRRRRAGRCARRSGSAHARASAPRRRRRAGRGGPGRWRRGASARAGRRALQFTRQTSTCGVVPAAVEDVGLGDGVRGQHALGLLRVDREVGAAADLRGGEAGLGLVGDAAERRAAGRGR